MFFLVLFLLFSLGDIAHLSFLNQEVNIYLYEVGYFGWVGWLVAKNRLKSLKHNRWRWLYGFIVVLLGTSLLSLYAFTPRENLIGFLYLFRLAVYVLGIPYVLHEINKGLNKNLIRGYILFIGLTVIFSLIQYSLYPNLRNLQYLGWDPHLYRMFGTVFDVSIAAAIYGLILLSLIFSGQLFIKRPVPRFVLIILYVIMGFLTYARGMYVSILTVFLYYFVAKNKQFRTALFLVLVVGAALLIVPKPFGEGGNLLRTSTINSRIQDYRGGVRIWQTSPFFGVGYNRLRYVKEQKPQLKEVEGVSHAGASLHSSFLIILVTSGIVGLIFFLVLLHSLWQISPTGQMYVLFLGLYSLFDNIFLHPFVLFLLTMLLAMEMAEK